MKSRNSNCTRRCDAHPYELSLREGIIIYPRGNPLGPRLPLLGLRALVQNNLEMVIDGQRRELTIRRKRRLFRGW